MADVKFYTKLDDELRDRILKALKEAEEWYRYLLCDASMRDKSNFNNVLMNKDFNELEDLIKELQDGKKEDVADCKWGSCICPLDIQERKALADLERKVR